MEILKQVCRHIICYHDGNLWNNCCICIYFYIWAMAWHTIVLLLVFMSAAGRRWSSTLPPRRSTTASPCRACRSSSPSWRRRSTTTLGSCPYRRPSIGFSPPPPSPSSPARTCSPATTATTTTASRTRIRTRKNVIRGRRVRSERSCTSINCGWCRRCSWSSPTWQCCATTSSSTRNSQRFAGLHHLDILRVIWQAYKQR